MKTGVVAIDRNEPDTVQICEKDFRALPCTIQLLIEQCATPVPSDTKGVLGFELAAHDRRQIEAELQKCSGTYRLASSAYFLNRYQCPGDGASWSSWSSGSPGKDCCPHCSQEATPVSSEAYIAMRYVNRADL